MSQNIIYHKIIGDAQSEILQKSKYNETIFQMDFQAIRAIRTIRAFRGIRAIIAILEIVAIMAIAFHVDQGYQWYHDYHGYCNIYTQIKNLTRRGKPR